MKKFLVVLLMSLSLVAYAKGGAGGGGHSSGGGGHASFSSSSRGGFSSSGRSFSSSRPSTPRTVTTTTTTRSYRSSYVSPGGYYGGMGMGYGYSNGLLTGLIIGDMMHPTGTTVYNGGGYSGQALLYPNGQVVNQNGQLVGNYANGQFSPVDNGPIVAQAVPADANQQPAPVVVQQQGTSGGEVAIIIFLTFLFSWMLFMILAV